MNHNSATASVHKDINHYPSTHEKLDWWITDHLIDYPTAMTKMETRVAEIQHEQARDTIWLLDHPPLYTAGISAQPKDLSNQAGFPVYASKRGGQYTYHGPGQRIAYTMLNLRSRGQDVRRFIFALEGWVIAALASFNLRVERRPGRVGLWVTDHHTGHEAKIAAIGVRIQHWVAYHGVAINVEPDLSHFSGIAPCGLSLKQYGVTSLVAEGLPVTTTDLDVALQANYAAWLSPQAFVKK